MAEKKYNLAFKLSDGTTKSVQFSVPYVRVGKDVPSYKEYKNTIASMQEYIDTLINRLEKLEDIVLTLDAPVIEVDGEPNKPRPLYYIKFSEYAVDQFYDKGVYVEIDGVGTTVMSGEYYYCNTCKIAGQESYYYYGMQYEGNCSIDGNGHLDKPGWYTEFNSVTITLNGDVTITSFYEK